MTGNLLTCEEVSQHQEDSARMFKFNDLSLKPIMNLFKPRKLKILIANDNPFQLLVASKSIMKVTYVDEIEEATNGLEALDLVKKTMQDT